MILSPFTDRVPDSIIRERRGQEGACSWHTIFTAAELTDPKLVAPTVTGFQQQEEDRQHYNDDFYSMLQPDHCGTYFITVL